MKFRTIVVRQIMKSRIDMFCINEKTEFEQLLKMVREAGYSRLPVYRESLDDVIGFIHSKDLIPYLLRPQDFELELVLQSPMYVVDTARHRPRALVPV